MIVDFFAGGGGTSLGIEMALGRSPDVAVNHDPEALAMHQANHPGTRHLVGNVWEYDPIAVTGGRPCELFVASPDCQHFSKCKGGKPRSARRRALAWVVVRWAKTVRPRVILMENVEEWLGWGPLTSDGLPCPRRRGQTFRAWAAALRKCGYVVEWRQLRACDYGSPTTRKRLFVVARCDGRPIIWPTPTHGFSLPYRTAAECIQWDIPCPSIFTRKRPLAGATMRRIARGVEKYVLSSPRPFVVGGRFAPTLIQTSYGERKGQAPRTLDLNKPLGTVMAGGQKHAIVAAFLAKHYGGHEGSGLPLTQPMATVTTQDHHALVTAPLGHRAPMVRAFLTQYNGQSIGHGAGVPLGTVTTKDRFGLVAVDGVDHEIQDIGMRLLVARELFRAQGFPDRWILDPIVNGKPLSHTAQVRMCGNSVSPLVAKAIVEANCS